MTTLKHYYAKKLIDKEQTRAEIIRTMESRHIPDWMKKDFQTVEQLNAEINELKRMVG